MFASREPFITTLINGLEYPAFTGCVTYAFPLMINASEHLYPASPHSISTFSSQLIPAHITTLEHPQQHTPIASELTGKYTRRVHNVLHPDPSIKGNTFTLAYYGFTVLVILSVKTFEV